MIIDLTFKETDWIIRALEAYSEEMSRNENVPWHYEEEVERLMTKIIKEMAPKNETP